MPGRGLVGTACGASAKPSIDCGVVRREANRAKSPASQSSASWLKNLGALVLIFGAASVVGTQSPDTLRGADFPDFYCAARMLLDGRGNQLYDADLQRQYQAM